jgi:glutathione S-transferase
MLKIYGVPLSVHTRKAIIAAKEKSLPYENEPVIPFTPPPGWDRLSPTGKIPVLVDGDTALPDSSVICAYLERNHPTPPLYPAGTQDYARALWFEEFADGTLFRDVIHGLFFQKVIRPGILRETTDQNAIEAILSNAMPRHFLYLETALLGRHFVGDCFTIADIAVLSNLINYHYLGFRLDPAQFPKLTHFFVTHLARSTLQSALIGERPFAERMGLDVHFQLDLTMA